MTRGALWGLAALFCASLPALADQQADPRPITWKRCSSTIAVGGTAQNAPLVQPAQPLRGFYLQNPSAATESLFFDPSGAASTTTGVSGELAAGVPMTFGPGTIFAGNLSVNAASGGHAFICFYGQ